MFNEVQGQLYWALPMSVYCVVLKVTQIQHGIGNKHTGAMKQWALSSCNMPTAEVLM
jgi:hypothetical protein